MDEAPQHRYWPCYCEENIWHLCAQPETETSGLKALVAFISNPQRQVALWWQSQADQPGVPVVWDYHVILLAGDAAGGWRVWDLDTDLGCPIPARLYLDLTFPHLKGADAAYTPLFRLLPADEYRRELKTDRRHMRHWTGHFLKPPPPWPLIGEGSNLMRFVDMEEDFLGEVLNLGELRKSLCIG